MQTHAVPHFAPRPHRCFNSTGYSAHSCLFNDLSAWMRTASFTGRRSGSSRSPPAVHGVLYVAPSYQVIGGYSALERWAGVSWAAFFGLRPRGRAEVPWSVPAWGLGCPSWLFLMLLLRHVVES